MEAVLKFNLPEEDLDFYNAINGTKFKVVLHEIDNHLRSIVKYSEDESKADIAQNIREKLHEYLLDYNISLE